MTNQAGGIISSQNASGLEVNVGTVTVTNAGTITGGNGIAVLFTLPGNTLILDTGSVLNGNVQSDSPTGNTVRLRGTGDRAEVITWRPGGEDVLMREARDMAMTMIDHHPYGVFVQGNRGELHHSST